MLKFTIPGIPVPCARARIYRNHGRTHGVTEKKTEAYEKLVALCARSAMARTRWVVGGRGPFSTTIRVYRAARRGDSDNFAKGVKDGLTQAGVWEDDRYVEHLVVWLYVDKVKPRVEVEVRQLKETA
jgi:Holliday junction resolvase RusA-like endonuclease